jgi:putative ABC transport system permease protein
MSRIALRMLLHRPTRLAATALGLGVLFLLSAAQVGLMVGWCNTISAIPRESGTDVWVMARQTPSFDYGTAIPRHRISQVRNVGGVSWAEGMYAGWSMWQRPDGRRVSVQLVGLDRSSVGGPWVLRDGAADVVHQPNGVVVDELFCDALGVRHVGDQGVMYGERATVRGVSRGVRTFTASPFVFCALKSAPRYDKGFRPDETTYVLVRAAPGVAPDDLARRIEAEVPAVEALSTRAFIRRSILYWMLETGMGITVVLTALLGVLVGVVVTSQTLFTTTQEFLPNYATLLAVGFGRTQLLLCVLAQAVTLSAAGVAIGSLGFLAAARASAGTPVPLEMTPAVYAGLIGVSAAGSLVGALASLRAVFRIDPAAVFRG